MTLYIIYMIKLKKKKTTQVDMINKYFQQKEQNERDQNIDGLYKLTTQALNI